MRFLVFMMCLIASVSQAQIVTVPIPGAPGLSVTVGVGVNALPLQNIHTNPAATNITTYDDNIVEVPLGFTFPFFGRSFTTSWAATNGFVTFQNPWQSGLGGGCCSGVDLRTTTNSAYNYTIYGIHTDLYSWNGANQWYLREANAMTYGWYNISQCCGSQGGNSFEIKITSSGTVDTRIAGAMVNWNPVTSGMAGDLSKGEYYQYYHGAGLNITPGSANIFSWNTVGGFTGADPCISNPLSSPTCSGYAAAYLTQQCTITALYDPSCPGYAQAYFDQQCSINPLYNQSCPGYASAYFTQQCNANPLYNRDCPGYAQAYYDQQCSLNPLYDSGCTGYAQAYFNQQCNANPLYNNQCPGYGQAYFNQQCSLNPLYNVNCSGYTQAFHNQQCSINPLYASDCPGYAQAYYDQQCSLNGLYDRKCPNYSQAYATQQLLSQQKTQTTTNTINTTSSSQTTATAAIVSDQNVNSTITNNSTAAAPSASPAAVTTAVPLTQQTTTGAPAAITSTAITQSTSQSTTAPPAPSGTSQNQQPTTRAQQIQQARVEAAKRETAAKGKEAQKEAGQAKSMEQQVAAQGAVIAAMGYNASFDAYSAVILKDSPFYKSFEIYKDKGNVDNNRALRGLYGPSENRHQQLIELQYQ